MIRQASFAVALAVCAVALGALDNAAPRVATVAAQESAPPAATELVRVQPVAPVTIAPGTAFESALMACSTGVPGALA